MLLGSHVNLKYQCELRSRIPSLLFDCITAVAHHELKTQIFRHGCNKMMC